MNSSSFIFSLSYLRTFHVPIQSVTESMAVTKTKQGGLVFLLICVAILNIQLMRSGQSISSWGTDISKDLNLMSGNDAIKDAISSATGSIFENRRIRTFPQNKRNTYNNNHKQIQ